VVGSALLRLRDPTSEDIELRNLPQGWREPGFDDSAWAKAFVRCVPYPAPYTMTLQPRRPSNTAGSILVGTENRRRKVSSRIFGEERVGATRSACRERRAGS
jgi:hypothetical protein